MTDKKEPMREITPRQIHDFVERGDLLRDIEKHDQSRREQCNHQKGGFIKRGEDGLPHMPEKGDNARDYCVIKHQFHWGDVWVICLRCGQKWKPGMPDYQKALQLPTSNATSTAVQIGRTIRVDVEPARELTKDA
jgi:hypothetical protein